MLKFTERAKTPGMTSKKNIAFPEGNKQFSGDFVLIWTKQRLIWFSLQRDGTRNGFSNIRRLLQKICSYKCQFCTKVWASSKAGLTSSYDGWAKCKEKVPVCQITIKMLKQHATPNSSLHNLKIYSSKGCRKTSQRWIYVASYVATYLANTAVLSIRIFSRRYHFRL